MSPRILRQMHSSSAATVPEMRLQHDLQGAVRHLRLLVALSSELKLEAVAEDMAVMQLVVRPENCYELQHYGPVCQQFIRVPLLDGRKYLNCSTVASKLT